MKSSACQSYPPLKMNSYIRTARYIVHDTDPFAVRELLLILFFAITINNFFGYSRLIGPALPFEFIASLGSPIFITIILYASLESSFFARAFEKGYQGYIFSLAVRRRSYLFMRFLVSTTIFTVILVLAITFLSIVEIQKFDPPYLLALVLIINTSCLLYTSIGYLAAVLTKNSMLSFVITFFIFFALYLSTDRIFPNWEVGQYLISLANTLQQFLLGFPQIVLVWIVFFTLAIGIVWLSYVITAKSNLRSGR